MPYLTAAELETIVGSNRLREIADPDNESKINATIVAEALLAAQSKIDRYLAKKRAVPLADPVPQLVRQYMIDETVYVLKGRNRNMVTVEDVAAADLRERMCKDIASGAIVLDVAVQPPASELVIDKSGPRDSTKTASRKALEGGW